MQWMDFEIRIRTNIKDLIEPVIMKGLEDRELIQKLERKRKNFEERIMVLEASVFKDK